MKELINYLIQVSTLLIILSLVYRLAFRKKRIFGLRFRNKSFRNGNHVFVITNGLPAFSFFNWIFIRQEEFDRGDLSLVLKHEMAHVNQGHTVDLMVAEIVQTILWFNPLVFLTIKDLKETHEYQADRKVLNSGTSFEEYAVSLQSEIFRFRQPRFVNYFKGSNIKNRLTMASKTPKQEHSGRYLLIIPVFLSCLILWSFIQDPIQTSVAATNSKNMIIIIDPGHGGKDLGAVNTSLGFQEKDLNLAMALELEKIPHPGIEYKFTRKTDEFLTLQNRYSQTEKTSCTLLISIHLQAQKNPRIKGPSIYYSSLNSNPDGSKNAADYLAKTLDTFTRDERFLVLKHSSCPAVLISPGLISNPEEASWFASAPGREKFAKDLTSALLELKAQALIPSH